MSPRPERPVLFVLAGVNGAGKSSLGGALVRSTGLSYFNPDEAARRIRSKTGCTVRKLYDTPEWAKAIVAAALKLQRTLR